MKSTLDKGLHIFDPPESRHNRIVRRWVKKQERKGCTCVADIKDYRKPPKINGETLDAICISPSGPPVRSLEVERCKDLKTPKAKAQHRAGLDLAKDTGGTHERIIFDRCPPKKKLWSPQPQDDLDQHSNSATEPDHNPHVLCMEKTARAVQLPVVTDIDTLLPLLLRIADRV